jgi:hypothetical protein
MYNLATQVQVPRDTNLSSYYLKTKITVGASPTVFRSKKKYTCNWCINQVCMSIPDSHINNHQEICLRLIHSISLNNSKA